MWRPDLGVFLTVISHRRAGNVRAMTEKVGPATWVVADEADFDAYVDAGAAEVIVAGGGVVGGRNAALHAAWAEDRPAMLLDDDLKIIQRIDPRDGRATTLSFAAAVQTFLLAREMNPHGYLVGGPPTSNSFFSARSSEWGTVQFIIASAIIVWPCDLYFDAALTLKEDYDYTLQHLQTFGIVVRCNWITWEFAHYTNKGGCQEYRNADREDTAIAYLRAKWGDVVVLHPSRPHEVLLRWPAPLKRIDL